jgi:hypothetical protein
MNIIEALNESRETKMALKKQWWPEGYYLIQNGAFLTDAHGGVYRFDVESLVSVDWILTSENPDKNNG